MDDPETQELIAHFAALVAQRAWGTVVLEQVPAFFGSTAWEMVLGRATAAGYLLVGVVKVDVRDCGLYQSRTRCIAVLTLQGPPKYDFESCVRALAALEAADTLRLADYFVAPHQYAEYGVSLDDAREHRLLTAEEASKLEHALAIRKVDGKPAPLTVKQAARHWCFVDLDRSESWVHALEGCVLTPQSDTNPPSRGTTNTVRSWERNPCIEMDGGQQPSQRATWLISSMWLSTSVSCILSMRIRLPPFAASCHICLGHTRPQGETTHSKSTMQPMLRRGCEPWNDGNQGVQPGKGQLHLTC